MNPSLILVRHSTPAIDPSVPSTDWRLSSAGIDAARRLAIQLEPFKPIRLLSSPERKARETAEIMGKRFRLKVQVESDFQEHKRQAGAFLPIEDFETGISALFRLPGVAAFGSESALDVFGRIAPSLATLASHEGPSVVVSHGTAIAIYMSQTFGVDGFTFWQSLKTPTAIVIRPNGWSLQSPQASEAR